LIPEVILSRENVFLTVYRYCLEAANLSWENRYAARLGGIFEKSLSGECVPLKVSQLLNAGIA
jgi:hypothetical protein